MDGLAKLALTKHLEYELVMLDTAYAVLANNSVENGFSKNAAIEAFWVHARNLLEFFSQPKNETSSGIVSARDFTDNYRQLFTKEDEDSLVDLVNDQITHFRYERKATSEEQLNLSEMIRMKGIIDKETRRFQAALTLEAQSLWEERSACAAVPYQDAAINQISTTTAGVLTVGNVIDRRE